VGGRSGGGGGGLFDLFLFLSLSPNQKSAPFPQVVLAHLDDGKEGDKEESACPPFELLISWGPYNCFSFFSLSARTASFFICFRSPTPPSFFSFPFSQRSIHTGYKSRPHRPEGERKFLSQRPTGGGEGSLWKDTYLSPVTLTAVFSLHRFLCSVARHFPFIQPRTLLILSSPLTRLRQSHLPSIQPAYLSYLSTGIRDAVGRASQRSLPGCRPCTASISMFLPPFTFWCWGEGGEIWTYSHPYTTYIK